MRLVARFLAVFVAVCAGVYVWRNPESRTLDDAARATASGKFVTLPTGVTHYTIDGPDTGRVVVLVHGNSVPLYIWDTTAVRLSAAGYRVVRYDTYGRGWSDRPDAAYDGALYDGQLSGLLDSLHITGPIDLFGLSFGGYIVTEFASSHPERVRTLGLVDPVATVRTVPWYIAAPILGPYFWQVMVVPGMPAGQPGDMIHPERYPDWEARYRPQMAYRGFGRALYRSAMAMHQPDFAAMYAKIEQAKIPTLLVWGRQDPTLPFANSEIVKRGIPSLEFFAVDSSGHLPQMEQPDVFHARVLAFLASHPAAATPTK